MFNMRQNNTKYQVSPAFNSLSFKAKRSIDSSVFSKLDIKKTQYPVVQYPKNNKSKSSMISNDSDAQGGLTEGCLRLKDTQGGLTEGCLRLKETENKTPKKEFRAKVYGAIMRYKDKNTNEIYYALIQGRYTGKWSFPKGHSNKGEEPYDCVKREVYEETGISNLPNSSSDQRIGFGHYYIFDVEAKYHLNPQDCKEVMDKRWVTLKEMEQLQLNVDASYFKKMLLSE
jgi:8-oxo-dGTP pyrophosphatase MutT (NUDIX family)